RGEGRNTGDDEPRRCPRIRGRARANALEHRHERARDRALDHHVASGGKGVHGVPAQTSTTKRARQPVGAALVAASQVSGARQCACARRCSTVPPSMAFVPLVPIGDPLDKLVDERTAHDQRAALAVLEDRLRARRAEVHAGWGPTSAARVHKKGRLTTGEALARPNHPGTRTFEVGTFVNYGEIFPGNQKSPAAGVVTAFARIEGRWCMVIANDNTVASGAWWPRTPEKIQRAQMMALRLRLPTIYLVDCSGLFLPEQSKSFGGATGAGHIFKMNSLLSAHGVPQLAGVFGDCIAGGGYMPIISDRVYMTEQAYMVIAGAALIKGAKSQKITSLDIGGPEVHVHQSGCADVRVPDDETLLACLRRDVARLPSSGADFYRGDLGVVDPRFAPGELAAIVPADQREAYDATHELTSYEA